MDRYHPVSDIQYFIMLINSQKEWQEREEFLKKCVDEHCEETLEARGSRISLLKEHQIEMANMKGGLNPNLSLHILRFCFAMSLS